MNSLSLSFNRWILAIFVKKVRRLEDFSADSEGTDRRPPLILEERRRRDGDGRYEIRNFRRGRERGLCSASKMYFKRARYTFCSTMIHGGDFWYDSITKLVNLETLFVTLLIKIWPWRRLITPRFINKLEARL